MNYSAGELTPKSNHVYVKNFGNQTSACNQLHETDGQRQDNTKNKIMPLTTVCLKELVSRAQARTGAKLSLHTYVWNMNEYLHV